MDLFGSNNYEVARTAMAVERIADDVNTLVIASARRDFAEPEIADIERFLVRGGSLMVFLAPTAKPLDRLEALLARWGVSVGTGLVLEPRAHVSDNRVNIIPMYAQHPINRYFSDTRAYLLMPSARTLASSDKPSFDLDVMAVLSSTPDADYSADEMRAFIFLLARLTASQALELQQNLADFGLREPRASLALILRDGRTLRMRLGKPSAVGDGYYFQKEGDARVFVIGKLTGDLMLRARSDFWNKQLMPELTAQTVNRLTSVQLASCLQPNANWRLAHRGDASFQLAQPVNGLVHAESAFKLVLFPLSALQADALVSATGPLLAYGLDQPTQELTLQWDGQPIRILVAPAPNGGFFLNRTGHPAVFSLSGEKAAFLRLAYRDLLGDRVYNGSLAAVAAITLARPLEQIVYRLSIRGEGVGKAWACPA